MLESFSIFKSRYTVGPLRGLLTCLDVFSHMRLSKIVDYLEVREDLEREALGFYFQ